MRHRFDDHAHHVTCGTYSSIQEGFWSDSGEHGNHGPSFWLEGRATEKILPDGRKHLYSYQASSGRLAAVAFPKDAAAFAAGGAATIRYGYSADGALAKVDYGDATIPDVTYAYDSLGRLSSMLDGQGTTAYTYDPLFQVRRIIP